MKKLLTLLIAFFITAMSFAQAVSKLTGQRRDFYDVPSSSWYFFDSVLYQYNDLAQDTTLKAYGYSQNTWKAISKYEKLFDLAGNNTTVTTGSYDSATGQLAGFEFKISFDHNSYGDTIMTLTQKWDTLTNNWRNMYRIYNYKDASRRDTLLLVQTFTTGSWRSNQSATIVYNSAGKIQTTTIGSWNSSNQFSYLSRNRNTYDSNGELAIMTRQQWDPNTSAWISKARHNYTWTGGDQTQREYQTYDANTSTWENDSLNTMTYDGGHHLTSRVIKLYNGNTSVYDNRIQLSYSYDAQGNMLTYELDVWLNSQWKHSNHYDYQYNSHNQILYEYSQRAASGSTVYDPYYRYYYYYKDISTGLTDIKSSVAPALYPNPTSGIATMTIVGEKESTAIITISDLQGRTISVETRNIHNGVNEVRLNISDLPSGQYLVAAATASGIRYAPARLVKN